jgi:hypothetical protein
MGRQAWAMKRDRWLMTGIIHQASIDKKRKKCRITIEMADKFDPQNILISPSVHRIS